MKKYWLIKTEPNVYSIDDLKNDGATSWDGIRNYQARNFIRDDMSVGDMLLLYHSAVKPPCVAGVARVIRSAYPDHTARDKLNDYYDPKSTEENPIWYMVDVEFVWKFNRFVTLDTIRNHPGLIDIMVARRGIRLSIQPVTKTHFDIITRLGSGHK